MILEIEKNGKKKVKIKQQKTEKAQPKDYVVIDYPKNGEALLSPRYTARIGASAAPVEISIDGSPWKACRHAGGYFWFDWNSIAAGERKLTARIKTAGGKLIKSKTVNCKMK